MDHKTGEKHFYYFSDRILIYNPHKSSLKRLPVISPPQTPFEALLVRHMCSSEDWPPDVTMEACVKSLLRLGTFSYFEHFKAL